MRARVVEIHETKFGSVGIRSMMTALGVCLSAVAVLYVIVTGDL